MEQLLVEVGWLTPVVTCRGRRADHDVVVSSSHHRHVHELGFRVEARDDGSFAFFSPAGWEVKPTFAVAPLAPIAALRDQHLAAGLAIDERTSFPGWDGTPPDYHHIVHVLATKYPPPPD